MFAVSKNAALHIKILYVITIIIYKTWNLLFKINFKFFKDFDDNSWFINNLGIF